MTKTEDNILVAILDDHPGILDGVEFRLSKDPEIEIVGRATFGDEIEPILDAHPVDGMGIE